MSTKAYSSYTIIDVVDGMQWQPDATSHPANPQEGWAYYNTAERKSYLYDGEKWVVFAKDGTSVKKINTHVRNFSLQRWQTYGEAGHEENWTTGEDYDNSHINIGDTAYLIGTISDVVGAGGLPAEAMLYGIVTQVVKNHVRMTSSHVITGGANGTNGKDGADFDETVQYCQHASYSTAPSTTSSEWADTFPTSWDNSKPYVWKRTKKVWNQKDESGTVKTTYTSPELISQLEVATIMAKDAGMTLDDWCVENDVTVISGSQIATGTLTADHVDVGGDLSAFGATIGGWEITDTSIEATNGTTTIGLYSGGEEYDSLSASETTSPIRLKCSGALVIRYGVLTGIVGGDGVVSIDVEIPDYMIEILDCTAVDSSVTVCSYSVSNNILTIEVDSPYNGDVEFNVTYKTYGGFMLLEDGSLYAEAARIEGEIVANKGTFQGEINAESGTIGGLKIDEEGILSESSSLAFLPNGLITADKLSLKNYFEASTIRTQRISGRNNGSAYLLLESAGTSSENVTITVSINKIKDGATNWWGDIASDGQVDITLTASKSLTIEQNVRIRIVYNFENAYNDFTKVVTMQAGTSSASFSVPELRQCYHNGYKRKFRFSHCDSPVIVTQPKASATSAIASSTDFVPLSTQQQSLGATDKVWNYIYRLNESNGSDRKIKDNISDIDDNFSKQLIEGLSPKSYIFKTAKTPRTHYGFIAQDVEELLHSLGTSADEVGIVCKSLPGEPDGENNYYGLNYTNLIAPMVSVIQQLSKRVEELENKLNTKQND